MVGEIYAKRTGIDDGIVTMKMHKECEEESSRWHPDDWESLSVYEMEWPVLEYRQIKDLSRRSPKLGELWC